jgi:hypothetical protein
MIALKNKGQVVKEEIALKKETAQKSGFYKTYNRTAPLDEANSDSKMFYPAAILLIGILLMTTVLSIDNPVFFGKLLACNFIVFFAILLKYAGFNKSKEV